MLITLSRRAAICQSVTGVAPLGAVSHRFNFFNLISTIIITIMKILRLSFNNDRNIRKKFKVFIVESKDYYVFQN